MVTKLFTVVWFIRGDGKFSVWAYLKIEKRINNSGSRKRVREIKQCKGDNNYSRSFEEDSFPRLVRDIERTE